MIVISYSEIKNEQKKTVLSKMSALKVPVNPKWCFLFSFKTCQHIFFNLKPRGKILGFFQSPPANFVKVLFYCWKSVCYCHSVQRTIDHCYAHTQLSLKLA